MQSLPWQRTVSLLLLNALVWWVLAGPAWGFGVFAIVLATAAGLALPAGQAVHYSVSGALWFSGYFLVQSVLGGVDVARRAFSPTLPLDLTWQRYPLRLQGDPARTLFINAISLLPGTLSAELEGDIVLVHGLTAQSLEELATLESRVGHLFCQSLENPHP